MFAIVFGKISPLTSKNLFSGTVVKLKENAVQYDYEPVGTWIGPIYYVSIVKPKDIQVGYAHLTFLRKVVKVLFYLQYTVRN